jgi:hypothetical protein
MINENENENLEQEEESSIKRDKIFDNDYEQTEMELPSTSFSIDQNFREKTIDEKIDEQVVGDHVRSILTNSVIYRRFSEPNEKGEYTKINKSEINEIYSFVISNLSGYPKIEIFSTLTEFYDVSPEKFYESLSNTFKTELIIELRNRGYLKKRNYLF